MDSLETTPDEVDTLEPEQRALLDTLQRVTLGEYDVYCRIGSGGMASVYLALELSLNRPVAIKVISPSTLANKTLIDRFWLEARTAASLSHPHVIPIFAVRCIDNLHFFVMKHVEGGSLDTLLKRDGRLSFPLIRAILCQAASALAYAHRRGVIHRDIKPGNIMLDDEGFAVVMDFGIAKVKDVDDLTASGMTVGTPFYMSPEQFSNRALDGRADQYSLGVVAFELLTGRRPFIGNSIPQILRGHLLESPPDVRDFRPDCPAPVAEAVQRMLAKSPEERFPTLEPFVGILEGIPGIDQEQLRAQISSLARSMSLSQPRITLVAPKPGSRSVSARVVTAKKETPEFSAKVQVPTKRSWKTRRSLLYSLASVMAITGALSFAAAMKKAPDDRTPPRQVAMIPSPQGSSKVIALTPPEAGVQEPAEVAAKKTDVPTNTPAPPKTQKGRIEAPKQPSTTASKPMEDIQSMMRQSVDSQLPGAMAQSIVVPPPEVAKPVIFDGAFRIGSRVPRAGLYIDGTFAGLIGAIRTFSHKPGQVRLQIKAEECVSWDTVMYLAPADTVQIAFRNPRCSQ